MNLSATNRGAFSTFLLEMALDQQRMRERVAQKLHDHRFVNGVKRYTQPKMCKRLAERLHGEGAAPINLRTYQHWEGGDVLPGWDVLEAIAEELEITLAELIGDEEATTPAAVADLPKTPPDLGLLLERLEALGDDVAALRDDVAELRRDGHDQQPPARRRRPGTPR